jgi:hypothetical protein
MSRRCRYPFGKIRRQVFRLPVAPFTFGEHGVARFQSIVIAIAEELDRIIAIPGSFQFPVSMQPHSKRAPRHVWS